MKMEKPFFCLVEMLVSFLDFIGSFEDIIRSIEKTIFFGFLSPFSKTLYMAVVMFNPVFNQVGKVIVTKFFSYCYSLLFRNMEFMV